MVMQFSIQTQEAATTTVIPERIEGPSGFAGAQGQQAPVTQ